GHFGAGTLAQLPPQILDDCVGKRDREDAVLDAVDLKDLAETRPDQRAEGEIHPREGGPLARRAAAEIPAGDENFGVSVSWIVQHEIAARAASFVEAKIIQKCL